MTRIVFGAIVSACAATLLLAGCASGQPAGDADDGVTIHPAEPSATIAASGEVIGQGMVLQIEGEPVKLCLGAVMESYPPQCSGTEPDIVNWDWASADGEESANSVTWGTYAVQGTWDGERLTVTQPPIMLALYDPMVVPDPHRDPANAGATPEAELLEIQNDLHELGTVEVLYSSPENGYLFVGVIYDDGQFQEYFDALYGADVIAVQSQLRPVAP